VLLIILFFVTDTGKIRVFDMLTSKCVSVLQEKQTYYSLNGVEIIGPYLICAVVERGIRIWNWKQSKLLKNLPEELPECRLVETGELVRIGDVLFINSVLLGDLKVWQL